MDSALPIIPQPLFGQPLTLAEGPGTEGGFDFSALFLGLTAGAEGEAGQNPQAQQERQGQQDPQDPQAQAALLFQASGTTPESPPATLLANADTLETSVYAEGPISPEAAGDLLPLGASLLPLTPSPQLQEVQASLLLAESEGDGPRLLFPGKEVTAQTQPQIFSTREDRGTELPDGPQQPHGLFSFDADTEQSGLSVTKEQSLGVSQQQGSTLQGAAVTSGIQQPALSGAVLQNVQDVQNSQNIQNIQTVAEQDKTDAHVLSTQVSLRHTGLRTEPDVPEGIRESQLPLKNIAQTNLTLAGRTPEQSPGLSHLGIGSSAQGQAAPYETIVQQGSSLTAPETEFDSSGQPLATQAAAGSELFETQAALKGLALRGIQNDLEQPQTQQARQAFTETLAGLGVGSSVQDELQTAAVLDAQRAEELRHNILERVATEMAARLQLNQREARIQLNPPELGGLKIELVVNGEQVHARIVAEVAEVGSLLKNNMSDLKQALQSQGLDLSSVQVDVSSRGGGHAEQGGHNGHTAQAQQFQNDDGTPKGRQQPDAPGQENHGEGRADEQQPGPAASVPNSRGVNVRV